MDSLDRTDEAKAPLLRAPLLALPDDEPRAREGRHELCTQLDFRHMRGFLNGRSFDAEDMTAVADDVHIHGVRLRVVERSGGMMRNCLFTAA
jgi:hypothetical protein